MTYPPLKMPTQARCDRVPPTDGAKWDALDLRVLQEDDLPLDPRSWGRAEVGTWVARGGGLAERFPMNGKALCLMTKEMFTSRVPHAGFALHQVRQHQMKPFGHEWQSQAHLSLRAIDEVDVIATLLRDFRRRLAKALAFQELIEKLTR